MMHYRLWDELDRVISRYRHLIFWWTMAAGWLVAAAVMLVAWWTGLLSGLATREMLALLGVVVVGLSCICGWRIVNRTPTYLRVARDIENVFPELRSSLLAAIEQRPELPNGRFGFLQTGVIREAIEHARKHSWSEVVPGRRIAVAALTHFGSLGVFVLTLAVITLWEPPQGSLASRGEKQPPNLGDFEFVVEPGNTEIESGTSLLVLARIKGNMPPEASLSFGSSDGDEERIEMSRSLDDPLFGGRISSVTAPINYSVSIGELRSPVYRVEVFEYPRLQRADARLVFPSYTQMPEKLVQDVSSISVVEGTEITLLCFLNKKVTSARLVEKGEPDLDLKASADQEAAYAMTMHCVKTRRLKLELADEKGRKNVHQSEFLIQVVRNQPPNLKPLYPSKDVEVSPLEELDTRAVAFDDFGLKRFGVSYALAGREPIDAILVENAAAKEKHERSHVLNFENLKAEPDQLLSYFYWAEDVGPDGSIRRTESDMYFAEVRHFEEIFREGQSPPGGESRQQQGQQGESENAQDAESIAKLQKEIINATWKVIRREITDKLTDKFAGDTEQLYLSQASVQQQATALGDKLQDRTSQEHLVTALEAIKLAVEHLKKAHETPASDPLRPALAAEQAAYQAMLKLRAREHSIVRQRQRSSSASSGRSQQQQRQFQQLDLKQEENRYEQQRTAQSTEESPQDRENRQLLNRLRELARRQHDLNERLNEMQTALEEAKTEEQREEIRKQLKRLQDEQRQILRDTDELQTRMESPENMEQMSQERQQLEEAREDARRASEALDQEKPTLASASGSRAEKGFEELRNEFRRRAANRFTEDAQQLRDAARQLDEKERDIARQLNEPKEPTGQKSLRDSGDRERITQQVAEQRQRLTNLTEQVRKTIVDAEQAEPLLSERLYEAARTLQQQKTEQALSATEQSLRQGLVKDAQRLEEIAGQGIKDFREQIEKAAESVLGDETEALRRAREELQLLSNQLNDEIARNQRQPGQQGQQQGQQGQQQGQQGQQQGQQGQQQGQQGQQQGQQGQQQGQQGQQQGQQGQQQGQQGQQQGQQGQQQGQQGQQQGQQGQQQGQQGQQQGQQGRTLGTTGDRNGGERRLGGASNLGGFGPFEDYVPRDISPIAGDDFREWSDRLRDVEEMVTDPELRAEVARIRDRARSIRAETRRHSALPNWDLVRMQVAEPLVEMRDRVVQELLRRASKHAVVPLDRDPVPPKFSEPTRRYYEHLGSGKQ